MARRSYKPSPSKKTNSQSARKSAKKKASRAQAASRKKSTSSDAEASVSKPTKKTAKKKSSKTGNRRTSKTGSTRNEPQRLQRYLAASGFGSRRQCEELIEDGRVEVDGETVKKLGTTVDPQSSKVKVDGVTLRQQKLVYYAVNKPTGVLSTNSDPRGRQRVVDLVPNSERVFPVGRLDASSQGLMLLTNDGDLAQQLSHPKYGVRKVYRVTVAGKIDGETMRSMRKGIYISEGFVRVEGAKILKSRAKATELEITLREGKNREIRRILARLGHKVQVLQRIAIGPLRLGDVPVGAHRKLSREEVQRLRLAVEHSRDEVESERAGGDARRSAAKRTAKRSGKKSTARRSAKKGGKRPEGRKDVVARRTGRKPTVSKFSFKPKSTDGGGSVIGGD